MTLRQSLRAIQEMRLPKIKQDLLKFDVVVNALIARSYRETGVQQSQQIDQLLEDTVRSAEEEANKAPSVDLSSLTVSSNMLDGWKRGDEDRKDLV
jgi:hypothetical protein